MIYKCYYFKPLRFLLLPTIVVLMLTGMTEFQDKKSDDELFRLHVSVADTIMQPGERQNLQFSVELRDGQQLELSELTKEQVRLVSLNPKVATVGSYGQIYARDFGAATIQAQVTMNGSTRTGYVRIGVPEQPLTEHDFILDGPYGSSGSNIEKIGENHFLLDRRSLPQFIIKNNFKGNNIKIDIQSLSLPSGGHNYHVAYSLDGKNWTPILQKEIRKNVSRIEIPPTNSNSLYFGFQIPLSYETAQRFMKEWASDPATSKFMEIHSIGKSIEGRKLYRMEISDPESSYKVEDRWVHYIAQSHPHEGKSRWRIKGMIDWLLSDAPEAIDARERHIWHFVFMMNPDGINNGFTRTNMEGIDMNRTYHASGADTSEQAHEGYLFQRDIEQLMDSDTPLTTFWDMHVWGRRVEPMTHLGPEFGDSEDQLGEWTELRDLIESYDEYDFIKPLETRDHEGNTTVWDRGVHHQFGITSSLVEGSGYLDTQEENMEAGVILIRSISEFYSGTRANPNPE